MDNESSTTTNYDINRIVVKKFIITPPDEYKQPDFVGAKRGEKA